MDEKITRLATLFRSAIEKSDRSNLVIGFKNFPRGSCGDACLLLGAYLIDAGVNPLIYVSAFRGEKSHAWLESDGLIIDITADQFDDCCQSVIVERESKWHRIFDRREENLADFREYDPHTVRQLSSAYDEIVRQISVST